MDCDTQFAQAVTGAQTAVSRWIRQGAREVLRVDRAVAESAAAQGTDAVLRLLHQLIGVLRGDVSAGSVQTNFVFATPAASEPNDLTRQVLLAVGMLDLEKQRDGWVAVPGWALLECATDNETASDVQVQGARRLQQGQDTDTVPSVSTRLAASARSQQRVPPYARGTSDLIVHSNRR